MSSGLATFLRLTACSGLCVSSTMSKVGRYCIKEGHFLVVAVVFKR